MTQLNQNESLLSLEDKGVSKAVGVLSTIFRKTLVELGVNPSMWHRLMLQYLNNPRNRIPNTSRSRSSTRGNLNKELNKPSMTWRNFEKGIWFLNPKKAVFVLKLTWGNGKTTLHSIDMVNTQTTDDGKRSKPELSQAAQSLLLEIGLNPLYIPNETTESTIGLLEHYGLIERFSVLGEKERGYRRRTPAWSLTEDGLEMVDLLHQ